VKLSIYEFKNLRRVYAIAEMEEYDPKILNVLMDLKEEELSRLVSKAFGSCRVLKYGRGAYVSDTRVEFMYLEVELEDYSMYIVEVYPKAITMIADTSFSDIQDKLRRLIQECERLS